MPEAKRVHWQSDHVVHFVQGCVSFSCCLWTEPSLFQGICMVFKTCSHIKLLLWNWEKITAIRLHKVVQGCIIGTGRSKSSAEAFMAAISPAVEVPVLLALVVVCSHPKPCSGRNHHWHCAEAITTSASYNKCLVANTVTRGWLSNVLTWLQRWSMLDLSPTWMKLPLCVVLNDEANHPAPKQWVAQELWAFCAVAGCVAGSPLQQGCLKVTQAAEIPCFSWEVGSD